MPDLSPYEHGDKAERLAWLAGLDAGAQVALSIPPRHRLPAYRVETVTRVTKTQVHVGSVKFRRKDGNRIGGIGETYALHPSRIFPVTEGLQEYIRSAAVLARADSLTYALYGRKNYVAQNKDADLAAAYVAALETAVAIADKMLAGLKHRL